jgi:hypothetical protein
MPKPYNDVQMIGALALVVAACYAPLLVFGTPAGHSNYLNLSWFAGFSEQFFRGDLYPRWLPTLNGGAGSPVFYFYGPLPFWFSTLTGGVICGACRLDYQLALGIWLMGIASALAFYLFARRFVRPEAAAISALAYAILPYHFEIDLLTRSAIGEFMIYLLMPLALDASYRLTRSLGGVVILAVVYALIIFNHLPSALLFSIALGAFVIGISATQRRSMILWRFPVAIVLGCSLAAVYLLPALLEQHTIAAHKWTEGNLDFRAWFLLDGKEAPGLATEASVTRAFLTAVFFGAAAWLLALVAGKHRFDFWWHWPVLAGAAVFLATPLSTFLWEAIPFLKKVQFPWRAVLIADLAAAIGVAAAVHFAMDSKRAVPRYLVYLLLGALSLVIAVPLLETRYQFEPFRSPEHVSGMWELVENGIDAAEYVPTSSIASRGLFAHEVSSKMAALPLLEMEHGSASLVSQSSRTFTISVSSKAPAVLTVRQFYYPIWSATAENGEPIELSAASPSGLLSISIPAGDYQLELRAVALASEVWGALISSTAALAVLFFTIGRLWGTSKESSLSAMRE